MLSIEDGKWLGGEPGGTHKVLSENSGDFLYKVAPDKGTYCTKKGGVVVFLRNLVPHEVKEGESGNGNAYGTGRTISWRVESVGKLAG
jgi:hypothetical protein